MTARFVDGSNEDDDGDNGGEKGLYTMLKRNKIHSKAHSAPDVLIVRIIRTNETARSFRILTNLIILRCHRVIVSGGNQSQI